MGLSHIFPPLRLSSTVLRPFQRILSAHLVSLMCRCVVYTTRRVANSPRHSPSLVNYGTSDHEVTEVCSIRGRGPIPLPRVPTPIFLQIDKTK
eukprot:scaffold209_cov207-Pinguiococcus_pyrenoidosus.AAC.1